MRVLAAASDRNGSRTTPLPDRFTLVNGRPQTIALKYPTGKSVPSRFGTGEQIMYTLADGRRAYFDPPVAREIDALLLAPGQAFTICKLGPQEWDIQYAQSSEVAAAKPVAPTPAPRPAPVQSGPVNGAGEDGAAIMARCYQDAIAIALGAIEHARAKGLMISPNFEDVRCIAATLVINQTGGRR